MVVNEFVDALTILDSQRRSYTRIGAGQIVVILPRRLALFQQGSVPGSRNRAGGRASATNSPSLGRHLGARVVVRATGSRGTMRNTITVMNAKGGVGKSTLVLALAETLANDHGKKILVIDSDAQASISHMLLPQDRLEAVQAGGRTLVDFLIGAVLKQSPAKWQEFVVGGVSDVDDARSIDLLPSDTHLTLFEREVSKGEHERQLRATVGALLADARLLYDLVLIDSAPGLSVLTESWLREADFYVSPTRPDYISTRGLKFLRQFRERDPHMGFAEPLGVIINMKDAHSPEDAQYEEWLQAGCREPLLPPADPARLAAAVGDALRRAPALLLGQVSGPDRRQPARARRRTAVAGRGVPAGCDLSTPRPAAARRGCAGRVGCVKPSARSPTR